MERLKLPAQNTELSFDKLYAQAIESVPLLKDFGNRILENLRKEFPGKFDDAEVKIGNTKDKDRAWEKIVKDYGGDCAWITDLIRGTAILTVI